MALVSLLGDKVVGGDGAEVDVTSLQGDGKVLGIYFSAHWCPPCRGFTPKLAEWYKTIREGPIGDKLTLVFVSSDRDEKSFNEYFAEMPWLALPFAKREEKKTLSKKFRVAGIPTLVLLSAQTGDVITTDGRSIVTDDPTGKEFPWTPKSLEEVLFSGELLSKNGNVPAADLKDKVLGIYFSAHWCGPCRSFTPDLVELYKKLKEQNQNFEIVFVSSDKDEEGFKVYFDEMPWLALPFGDSRKKSLSRMFDVSGIPCLVMIDSDGQTITTKARAAIAEDKEGKLFPWKPRSVRGLTGFTASDLNENAAVVWFNKKIPLDESLAQMKPLAEKKIAEWKAAKEDAKLLFYCCDGQADQDDDNMEVSLKKFAGLDASAQLAIVDIDSQKVYPCDETDVDIDVVTKFVDKFLAGSLTGKPISH